MSLFAEWQPKRKFESFGLSLKSLTEGLAGSESKMFARHK